MKCKLKKRRSGGRQLVVRIGKGEELVYTEAELIKHGGLPSFVACLEEGLSRDVILVYDVGMGVSLDELLKDPVDTGFLNSLLFSLRRLLEDCEANGIKRQHVMLDLAHVYYFGEADTFGYVCIPLQTYTSVYGVAELLVSFCDKARVSAADESLRAAVANFAKSTPVVTRTAFNAFLGKNVGFGDVNDSSGCSGRQSETVVIGCAGNRVDAYARNGDSRKHTAPFMLCDLGSGAEYELVAGMHLVGRSSLCSIGSEDDLSLSREHARFVVDAGGCFVCDLDSTNGVSVNGQLVTPQTLVRIDCGDRIVLGQSVYELR